MHSWADSPWVEMVPEGWRLIKLKWTVSSCKNGFWGSEPIEEDAIICLRVADFNRNKFCINEENLTFRSIDIKDQKGRLLNDGDLLLEKSGGGDKQLVGAVVQYKDIGKAITSNFIARMEPKKNYSSRFLTYLHAHLYSIKVNLRSINQTTGIQNLDSSSYLNEKVAIPDLDIQRSIASFLDFKATQIDNLITTQVKLLKLLEEKRVSIITQAVTKGLNPNVRMKDSGVDWLGEIPEHWEIGRLKDYVLCNMESLSENCSQDYEFEYVDISSVNFKEGISNKELITFEKAPSRARRIVRPGDVIISTVRTYLKAIARIEQKDETCIVSTGFAVLTPKIMLDSKYLYLYVRSKNMIDAIMANSLGVSYPAINPSRLISLSIPVPPIEEQISINKEIELQLSDMKNLEDTIINAIAKLKEYRNSLITNAVTGKINLRDYDQEQENEKTH